MTTPIFNISISLRTYLQAALAPYHIPAFTSWPDSPGDQQAMRDADAYFIAHISPGETTWIQPVFLSCAFVCTPEFSPDGFWLQTITQLFISETLTYENPETAHMIPVYDLDAEIGQPALLRFLQTGDLPARLVTLLQQPPETWPPYRPKGQNVGLRLRTPTRGPEFEMGGSPLRSRFSLTMEYYEPGHLRGQDG